MAQYLVRASTPGSVSTIDVSAGDRVASGQVVVRLEIMKMEIAIESPVAGRVMTIHVERGQFVEQEHPLLTLATE